MNLSTDEAISKASKSTLIAYGSSSPVSSVCADPAGAQITKDEAKTALTSLKAILEKLQYELYAESAKGLLIVLQGLDSSGKDGTIRRVLGGVNPQGVRVVSFKAPSTHEMSHDFLWRIHSNMPKRGEIVVFNRSHYEDLIVPKAKENMSTQAVDSRIRHVREFEEYLRSESIYVLKFLLRISKAEQKDRLLARLSDPRKRWKFDASDLETRKAWDSFMLAMDYVVSETSVTDSPWRVIPSNKRWYRDYLVICAVIDQLQELKPKLPLGSNLDIKALEKYLQKS